MRRTVRWARGHRYPGGMYDDGSLSNAVAACSPFFARLISGNHYLSVEDHRAAISCFNRALQANPGCDNEDVYLSNRATAYFRIRECSLVGNNIRSSGRRRRRLFRSPGARRRDGSNACLQKRCKTDRVDFSGM